MTKEKKINRKDNKGKVLRKGESQRKDGTYMFRFTDECKKRKSIYAKTLAELREKELKIKRDKMDNIRLSVDYTVAQLVELYLSLSQKNLSFNTMESNENAYRNHIKNSWLGYKKIKDTKKSDIPLFYTELSEKLKNNSIHSIHRVLSQAFKLALDDQMIRTNPTYGALKNFPADTEEKTILTPQQLNDLILYVKNHPYYYRWYPLIVILSETMIRGGELCGLTWDDVDLKRKTIKIDHQIQYCKIKGKGKHILCICPPKTKNGKRTIPLTTKAYKAFIKQKELQFSLNLYSTTVIDGYENFVFPTRRGNPTYTMALDNMFRNLTNRYNKENSEPIPRLSCHVFRHTGCAIKAKDFFKLGLDPKILQTWMGHSSLTMTLGLYNHITEIDTQNAINELNSMIG